MIEEELETLETWNLQSIALDLKNQGFVSGYEEARPSIELYEVEIAEESLQLAEATNFDDDLDSSQ